MPKKNDAAENPLDGQKPVAKKGKSKKVVDTHQLDLFFTAYHPPAKDEDVKEDTLHAGRGIDQLVPEAKQAAKTELPQKTHETPIAEVERKQQHETIETPSAPLTDSPAPKTKETKKAPVKPEKIKKETQKPSKATPATPTAKGKEKGKPAKGKNR